MARRRAERPPGMRLLLDGMEKELHIPYRYSPTGQKP
jgi:hypothetical protein